MKRRLVKKYRDSYNKYITNVIDNAHNLNNLDNEYNKAFMLWKTYLSQFIESFSKSSNIVDIGCGLGHALYFFNKLGYKNTLGIDISQENINLLHKKRFNVKKEDAFNFLKKNQNSFDIITLFDLIEHFSKNEGILLLTLARKSLKKNGIVIVETFNASHPFSSRFYSDDITHETGFTPSSIKTLFNLSGFKEKKIFTINSFYIWHPNPMIYFLRKTVLLSIATVTEMFYKMLAASQGIVLKECKPILIGIGYKN